MIDKSPKLDGVTPRKALGVLFAVGALIVGGVLGLHLAAPKVQAAEVIEAPAEVAPAPAAAAQEEIPDGSAIIASSKSCDVYVNTANEGVYDWAVAKAKELNCSLRALWTQESDETSDQAEVSEPANPEAVDQAAAH